MLEVGEIRPIIERINGLDGEGLKSKKNIQKILCGLVSDCCNFIRGMEKEALSDTEIFQLLAQCKYVEDRYKPLGTSFADTDYLAEIVSIAKAADEHQAKFHLAEEVLYLIPNIVSAELIAQRSVLLIGEKDFSFAYSYAITHKDESINLIASEYQIYSYYGNLSIEFNAAISYLLENKVVIAYGLDATKLHQYSYLYSDDIGRFKRIQFNCPYDTRDGTSKGSLEKEHTKKLVAQFMASAKRLLNQNGRLHVSIQQPELKEAVGEYGEWGKKEYQQAYGLPKSAFKNRLEVVKVMGDIQKRYSKNVAKHLSEEEPEAMYVPFLGQGKAHRIHQFIFRPMTPLVDYFNYNTDEGSNSETDAEDKNKPSSPSRSRTPSPQSSS